MAWSLLTKMSGVLLFKANTHNVTRFPDIRGGSRSESQFWPDDIIQKELCHLVKNVTQNLIDSQRNCIRCQDLNVSTVPAEGLAPSSARTSAGTVMTKLGRLICTGLSSGHALEVIKISQYNQGRQCLKPVVTQMPLATKNWDGQVKFAAGQVKF